MISAVVPVYKSEDSLLACVQSLMKQTGVEMEIILVDDGSPDDCPALCDALAREDGRIRVIHKENGGVSSARNRGVEEARGEYIFFADSDDYVEPFILSELLKGMESADFVICGFHHHYIGKDVLKVPSVSGQTKKEDFLSLYGQGYLNMPWNKLYRRELTGRFDEGLSLGEDLLFNLDYLSRAQRIYVVAKPLYHYIQNDTGNTLSSMRRDDKLELAKRIWRETSEFYQNLTGTQDESGVINARLIQEVLDDVESLPFDKSRTKREKLAVIEGYCSDQELQDVVSCVNMKALDYRAIHFCMRRKWKHLTYLLCVLRGILVQMRRKNLEKEGRR